MAVRIVCAFCAEEYTMWLPVPAYLVKGPVSVPARVALCITHYLQLNPTHKRKQATS